MHCIGAWHSFLAYIIYGLTDPKVQLYVILGKKVIVTLVLIAVIALLFNSRKLCNIIAYK